jgi:hypothetical protein
MSGDVYTTGTIINFNGTQGALTFNTKISKDAILTQPTTISSLDTDYISIANASALQKIKKSDFLSQIATNTPVGTVITIAIKLGDIAPSGWIFCDGASISRTTYTNLFTAIGTTFGGSVSTFNVPNITDLDTGKIKYIIKY